jgi:3-methyladenine DNA glycosylase AlkD
VAVLEQVEGALRGLASPDKARSSQRFFKTGKGQYGEGDQFLGVTVPQQRKVAKQFYKTVSLEAMEQMLKSLWHEERLTALFMLVLTFQKGDEFKKAQVANLYLANTRRVNNWDLVDSSAHYILGPWLEFVSSSANQNKSDLTERLDGPNHHFSSTASSRSSTLHLKKSARNNGDFDLSYKSENPDYKIKVLRKLAQSKNLWERRIAMLTTFYYIQKGRADEALEIIEILKNDSHDLIQKAVGWMLREIGKRVHDDHCPARSAALKPAVRTRSTGRTSRLRASASPCIASPDNDLNCKEKVLITFLNENAATLPRTTLRYAIERLPKDVRKHYMKQP